MPASELVPATLPPPGDENTLYLVDLSGYVFRAYHALPPLSTSKGEPTHAVHGVASMLQKLIRERKPAMLAVATDSRATFRHALFEGYKATRRERPEDLNQQLARVREVVAALEICVYAREGFEADDVIATVVKQARDRGMQVVIVSADKDLLQLVGEGVVMYDTMRERVFGPKETEERMGVPPAQVRDLLALTGDSSDNVPGVPSVGPKTAAALLGQFGSLEGIYARLGEVSKPALRGKLEAHRADAEVSRALVTLREDVEVSLEPEEVRYRGPDPAALRKLYTELEFTRLVSALEPAPVESGEYRTLLDREALEKLVASIRARGEMAFFVALDRGDPMRGAICGIGIAREAGSGSYVPFASGGEGIERSEALAVLGPILEDETIAKYSADWKRDFLALARAGVRLRGGRFDTTLASYLLDAGRHAHGLEDVARTDLGVEITSYERVTDKQRGSQLGLPDVQVDRVRDWAGQRAEIVLRATAALRPRIESEGFRSLLADVELPLAEVLAEMERTGIRLDVDRIAVIAKDVDHRLEDLERRCVELAGGKAVNLGSPRQLEVLLFDDLKLPVVKRTKTARSTDAEVLEELAVVHPLPQAILEHRILSKLKSTYLDALPREVNPSTGRVHTRYNQAVAATGRLSSSDPNLQNIPIRTDVGRSIRSAFVPEPGWQILAADYSQIELRLLAHLSRDPELCEAYATREDVHVRTATALFGVAKENVTREMRGQAKTVNFAVIYGQTQFALARNLGIDRREAKRYIDAFFARYAGVTRYLDRVVEEARASGEVRTVLGRRRTLPDLASKNRQLRSAAERIARNTPIQGSAADIMKLAMVKLAASMKRERVESRMLLTVHDELVFEVPPKEKDAMTALVREAMESAFELSVPLEVELGWGTNWEEAH